MYFKYLHVIHFCLCLCLCCLFVSFIESFCLYIWECNYLRIHNVHIILTMDQWLAILVCLPDICLIFCLPFFWSGYQLDCLYVVWSTCWSVSLVAWLFVCLFLYRLSVGQSICGSFRFLLCLLVYPRSVYLKVCLFVCLLTGLFVDLSFVSRSTCRSVCLFVYLVASLLARGFIGWSTRWSVWQLVCPSLGRFTSWSVCLLVWLSLGRSTCLIVCASLGRSTCWSVCLLVCPSLGQSTCWSVCLFALILLLVGLLYLLVCLQYKFICLFGCLLVGLCLCCSVY